MHQDPLHRILLAIMETAGDSQPRPSSRMHSDGKLSFRRRVPEIQTQGLPLQIAGVALAVLSQALEWTADRQLAAHRRDPANSGRTCRSGLWRYSRHPNYFFEWLTWCGFGLATATALGWYAAIAPVAMWLSIRFVTGVPFTEKQAMASRGEDYRRYAAVTNAFFPWIPRRPAAGGPTAP